MIPTMVQLVLDLGHRPALGRESFLVAPSNEAAVAWLDRWPEWPAPALVVYGPPGCGKSHLLEAWRARSNASTERSPELVGKSRVKALALDGAEPIPEEDLFHLYNIIAERQGHLLLTARLPPVLWKTHLADLRSRLLASPSVAIGAPDDALLGAVLVKLFADRQVQVSQDVILWLLRRIERSFAGARDAVARLDAAALAHKRPVTVPLAREVLGSDDQSASDFAGVT
jgi:chromosomal replication initiation ATPase DnaA